MSLTPSDVKSIARLARLEVADEALEALGAELSGILSLVEQMNQVDTEAVAPMAHPLDTDQRLREDAVTEIDQREAFQAIAPNVEQGLYLVPRVVE